MMSPDQEEKGATIEEKETKIRVADPEVLRVKLLNLGFEAGEALLERDVYWERGRQVVRRVRTRGETISLAWKGPARDEEGANVRPEKEAEIGDPFEKIVKVLVAWGVGVEDKKEEIERVFRPGVNTVTIMEALVRYGFQVTDRMDKIRQTFTLPTEIPTEVKVRIDRVAFIGNYAEVEVKGERVGAIREVIEMLKLDRSVEETRLYEEIFADYCEKTGCPFKNEMTFEREKEWLSRQASV